MRTQHSPLFGSFGAEFCRQYLTSECDLEPPKTEGGLVPNNVSVDTGENCQPATVPLESALFGSWVPGKRFHHPVLTWIQQPEI